MSFKLKHISTQNESDSESDLDMQPSTSRQAQMRQQLRSERRQAKRTGIDMEYKVTVIRRFDDIHILDRVSIQINSGNFKQFVFADYHDLFFVQPQHNSDLLDNVHTNCVNNWLNIIQSNANFYSQLKWIFRKKLSPEYILIYLCLSRQDGNPFESFAKLFDHPSYEKPKLLEKLATNCLATIEIVRLSERRFVLHIFELVREIFEFITFSEYTVWFFVPRLNRYTTLDQVVRV